MNPNDVGYTEQNQTSETGFSAGVFTENDQQFEYNENCNTRVYYVVEPVGENSV